MPVQTARSPTSARRCRRGAHFARQSTDACSDAVAHVITDDDGTGRRLRDALEGSRPRFPPAVIALCSMGRREVPVPRADDLSANKVGPAPAGCR